MAGMNSTHGGPSGFGQRDSHGLPPKKPIDNANTLYKQARGRRGRNHVPPNNTFGVSREEREKVMSYKYFSPPAGVYNIKFNQCDAKDKITYILPNGSTIDKDPRFNYSQKDTLLWQPHAKELENDKIATFNHRSLCGKCLKKDCLGESLGGSCDHSLSPHRRSKDGFDHATDHTGSIQRLMGGSVQNAGETLQGTIDGDNIHIVDGYRSLQQTH